jgi:hypothetical protein
MYTGHRTVYYNDTMYMVALDDINAMYCGDIEQDSLDESISATAVYVVSSECYILGDMCSTIEEIRDENKFGEPVYEGNSDVEAPEVVMSDHFELGLDVSQTIESDINDVYNVSATYTSDQIIYIYAFEDEGILYIFYCRDRNEGFFMYSMQKET